jgi:hypothetical protein
MRDKTEVTGRAVVLGLGTLAFLRASEYSARLGGFCGFLGLPVL